VSLSATLYKPQEVKAALPVIFTLTPYTADRYHERAVYFARNGYVFALVDCRGRGNSGGVFEPFANEGRDAADVVEWFARQPWSNGKVAMWGGSYAGFDQWSALKEFPLHLTTIVPAAAAHPAVDFPFVKNVWFPYEMHWLTFTSGLTANEAVFDDQAFWIERFRRHYLEHRPFRELDRSVGNMSTHFQTWLAHPVPDAYWNAMVPSPAQYRRIDVPILTITGHYDDDQRGALEYYTRHMRFGSDAAKRRHYLIIGPWDHAGTRTPKRDVGGLTFGEASVVDLNQLHKEWYDWTMKCGQKPGFLKKRIAYYVVGAETWKYADSLEAISRAKRRLYLDSEGGQAGDAFHSGTLSTRKPGRSDPDRFTHDPLDVRPAELEREEIKNYITDQRYALNLVGNGVVYHTEPFGADVEVTGTPRFVTWIAMDVPDADFSVRLYEILLDGRSVRLTEDLMRARYRDSLTLPNLVRGGEINRYDFDSFTFGSRRVATGSRLRLVLACPNSIHVEKNYQGGGDVAEESTRDARTANVRVYHDANHPSYLDLPIVPTHA